ncbi:MAG: dihydrofolate reductase family protein [Gemmatirosa sp.]
MTYGAACSLDGYIAAADGGLDWIHFSTDVQTVMGQYWATVDTILMGRKTWEIAAAQAGGGSGDSGGISTYVFSRTLPELERPGVRLVRSDAGAFVRDLKAQPGRGICVMGGGELAASLLAAGVVDEVGLNIHPVLLGAGTPLFRDAGRRIPLALVENRTIDGGCVLATYRVVAQS